jgi:hypothetical protein
MYLQQVFRSCLNMRFTVMCGIIDLQSSTLTCTESALRLVYTLVSVAPDLVFLGVCYSERRQCCSRADFWYCIPSRCAVLADVYFIKTCCAQCRGSVFCIFRMCGCSGLFPRL